MQSYYFLSPFLNPWNVVAFPELVGQSLDNSEVKLVYCAAVSGKCYENVFGSKLICRTCQKNTKSFARRFFEGVELIPIVPVDESRVKRKYWDSESLLVYSCVSSFNSRFRPVQNNWTVRQEKIYSEMLAYGETFYEAALDFVGTLPAGSKVTLFNGRVYPSSIIRAAIKNTKHVQYETFEYAGEPNSIYRFENATVHDIDQARKDIESIRARGLGEDQTRLAQGFFDACIARFNQKVKPKASFNLSSTARKSIAIFLSSDDELASLGPQWKSKFTDDIPASVSRLSKLFSDFDLFVRIHPNQKGQGSKIVQKYRELDQQYENLKVIYPRDQVSSYELLRNSDFIVSFGSTISVEATYLGKPSLLLGKQMYDGLGVVYNPSSFSELEALVRGNVAPKDKNLALIYGYYRCRPGIKLKSACLQGSRALYNDLPVLEKNSMSYLVVKAWQHFLFLRSDSTFRSLVRLILIKLNLYDLKEDRLD